MIQQRVIGRHSRFSDVLRRSISLEIAGEKPWFTQISPVVAELCASEDMTIHIKGAFSLARSSATTGLICMNPGFSPAILRLIDRLSTSLKRLRRPMTRC